MEPYSYDRRVASHEDTQGEIQDYLNNLRKYLKRAEGRPALMLQLGDVLETPEITQTARRAEKQLEDIKALIQIAETADKSLDDLDKEWENLAKELASKGGSLEGITDQTIWDLPQFIKIRDLAEASRKLTFRLRREESIDWTVSAYLGEDVEIFKEISRKVPDISEFEEAWDIPSTLFEVLNNLGLDDLKESIEEYLKETGK